MKIYFDKYKLLLENIIKYNEEYIKLSLSQIKD